jgi:hypothetical protein
MSALLQPPAARVRLRTLLIAQALSSVCAASPSADPTSSLIDRMLALSIIALLIWLAHSDPAHEAPSLAARRGTLLCLGCAGLLLVVRLVAAIPYGA